jgi:hypothetical protein
LELESSVDVPDMVKLPAGTESLLDGFTIFTPIEGPACIWARAGELNKKYDRKVKVSPINVHFPIDNFIEIMMYELFYILIERIQQRFV